MRSMWSVGLPGASGSSSSRRGMPWCERFSDSSEAMIKISSIHRMLGLLKKDCSMKAVPFKYREIPQKVTG